MVSTPISPPALAAEEASKSDFLPMRLLEYWHLLSLDAPTVAIVWSWAFARAAGVVFHPLSALLLGMATWLLYVADRLLDGLQRPHADTLHKRHHFHARHRKAFLAIAIPSACLLAGLVFTHMDPAPRRDDIILSAAAAVYLLCVHLPGWRMRWFPKEGAVAVIFAIACVIPAWSRQPASHPWLLCSGILFSALCWMNCTAIELWEAGTAANRLHVLVNSSGINLRTACFLLATAAPMVAFASAANRHRGFEAVCIAIAASALLLLQLDHVKLRMQPLQLRAAADAVLLTPAAYLLIRTLSQRL